MIARAEKNSNVLLVQALPLTRHDDFKPSTFAYCGPEIRGRGKDNPVLVVRLEGQAESDGIPAALIF